ncbi:MAG: acyl-CoA thioesterase [Thermoguttaceae bacterium]
MQQNSLPIISHDFQIRVRYKDTDQMGVLYHGNYFTLFEVGRTELLRSFGYTYKEVEASGIFGVVVKASCSYFKPAKYDDLLTIRTTVKSMTRVKIEYQHLVLRDNELLAEGGITLAFIDKNGQVQRIPDTMKVM